MAKICLLCTKLIYTKIRQLLMFFMLLSALAISSNAATSTAATIANKITLSPAATQPSIRTSKLSNIYTWGHNTKYSTVIFDENVIVKGFSTLDIRYPKSNVLYSEYTIIGLYSYMYAIDKLDSAIGENLADDILVSIAEGGVGTNFTTLRFQSNARDDVEYNVKIFGLNV